MGYTPATIRAEFLKRPKCLLYEDSAANKMGLLCLQVVNNVEIYLYEKYAHKGSLYEKKTAAGGLTLPAGTNYGSNSKLYELNSTTTPVLPATLLYIKSLIVLGDSALKTDSKSTYDTPSTDGSGIPADNTVIATGDVYHELIDEDADTNLQIVIGTAAAGAAPKLELKYVPKLVLTTSDSAEVICPRGLYLTEFVPKFNSEIKKYLGHDGF